MKNYKIASADGARTEFHEKLGLTGAEVSINNLPAGASIPFIHEHKENEEIYIITKGSGTFNIDDDSFEVKKDDVIKVSPKGKRQLFASSNEDISYICIQVKENTLTEYTEKDAIID